MHGVKDMAMASVELGPVHTRASEKQKQTDIEETGTERGGGACARARARGMRELD